MTEHRITPELAIWEDKSPIAVTKPKGEEGIFAAWIVHGTHFDPPFTDYLMPIHRIGPEYLKQAPEEAGATHCISISPLCDCSPANPLHHAANNLHVLDAIWAFSFVAASDDEARAVALTLTDAIWSGLISPAFERREALDSFVCETFASYRPIICDRNDVEKPMNGSEVNASLMDVLHSIFGEGNVQPVRH